MLTLCGDGDEVEGSLLPAVAEAKTVLVLAM
jgi:hypothetical protein